MSFPETKEDKKAMTSILSPPLLTIDDLRRDDDDDDGVGDGVGDLDREGRWLKHFPARFSLSFEIGMNSSKFGENLFLAILDVVHFETTFLLFKKKTDDLLSEKLVYDFF